MANIDGNSQMTYSVRFWDDGIFTPTFETYSTNIRPSNERRNLVFGIVSRLTELPTMHQRITPAYAGIISMEKMRGYVYLLSAAEITPETIICRR